MKTIRFIHFLLVGLLFAACRPGSASQDAQPTARACYDQALAAFGTDSTQLGEQLLQQAMQLAGKEQDLHTLYLSQIELAKSLSWSNTEAALDMARRALQTYERRPDSERNHIIILDYIGTYASQQAYDADSSFDEALRYTRQAHELALASSDSLGSELVSQTLTSLANIYWAMDDYPEALRLAREATACAPAHLLLGAQQVLARCLVSCDSLEAAETVYRRMQPGKDLQAAYIVQSNLAKLALRRSDTEAAEAAIDEAFGHAEDLYFDALHQKDAYYQATLRQQQENERLRYDTRLHRRTLWGLFVILLLAGIAAALVMRYRIRLMAQRRLADAWSRKHEIDERLHETRRFRHEKQLRLQAEQLRQQAERLREQAEHLRQQEIQHREQEAESNRQLLQQRDSTISFLRDFIFQRSEIIKKLDANGDRHVHISAGDWWEVERTLNAIDYDRFARLRQSYPALREEDVQMCILTCLHVRNRTIGNIYGLTISAVQHRKLKLKKEIFGEEDPDMTLEQVLENV